MKDQPDAATVEDETVQCVRCGCDVERHYECDCGYDRVVFSAEDWERDIKDYRECR